jgi:hypothetical protein
MVAVIALTFTACKKNENGAKALKFNVTTEQLEVVDDELGGRMYLDANNCVRFDENDKLAIFSITTPDENDATPNSKRAIFNITNDGNDWAFESGEFAAQGAYYAYYPGDEQHVFIDRLAQGNRVRFRLDPNQVFRKDDNGRTLIPQNALYMASKADGTTAETAFFEMRNICGVLALNLYSVAAKKVTSIEVTDPSFHLVGDVTMKVHEVDPTEMTILFNNFNMNNAQIVARLRDYMTRVGYEINGDVRKTLTLDCPTHVQLGTNAAEATTFYLVLRPLALRDGCSVTVNFEGGTSKTITTEVNHMIRPNHISKMLPICVD